MLRRPVEYDDFTLRFGGCVGRAHEVVVEAHGRQGGGQVVAPLGSARIGRFFALLEGRNLSSQTVDDAPDLLPSQVGRCLFARLLRGEVLRLFEQSLADSQRRGKGLRLVLKADLRDRERAALVSLPWELLFRSEDGGFLSLDRRRSVVRFAELPEATSRVAVHGRLRILVAAACPPELSPLAVDVEIDHVREALRWRWLASASFLRHADLATLRERLVEGRHHVLHFIGHGDFDAVDGKGLLFFELAGGGCAPASGDDLAALVRDLPSLQLVVLNACNTAESAPGPGRNPFAGVATALVAGGVPRVLAMQAPVSDRSAIAFSRALYRRLAAGDPVDAATVEGRIAIVEANRHRSQPSSAGGPVRERPEWAVPVLYLRADGALRRRITHRGRVWAATAFVLLSCLASLPWLRRGEVRLHLGEFQVSGATRGLGDPTGAEFRDGLIQKLSTVSGRPRLLLAGVGEAHAAPQLRLPIVDYTVRGEIRLGDRPELVAEVFDDEGRLAARLPVASRPGGGLNLLELEQKLAVALLDRMGVRVDPATAAALARIPTDDEHAFLLNQEGAARLEQGDLEAAELALRGALAADPDYAAAVANLATLAARQGHHAAALEGYRAAVTALPAYAVFHFDLGSFVLHGLPGDAKARAAEAIPSLERAAQLDPAFAEAHNELGNALLELGRSADARDAFTTARELNPGLPQPHKNLGRVALAEGRPREAAEHLEEALRRYPAADLPGRAENLTRLAEARERLGDRLASCRALAQIHRIDPERLSPWTGDAKAIAERSGCSTVPSSFGGGGL